MTTVIPCCLRPVMDTAMDESQFRLLAWCSPAYPTGAFSYSHGMEWAVERGTVAALNRPFHAVAVAERAGVSHRRVQLQPRHGMGG